MQILRLGLTTALLITCQVANANVCPVDPNAPSGRKQWCGCPTSSAEAARATVLDLSDAVDDPLLKAAKTNGIKTIVRYYDWAHKPNETVQLERGELWRSISSTCQTTMTCKKVVTQDEIKAIHAAGMKVAVVFQHFSHDMDTWLDKKRPAYDADRAIQLAHALGQPKNSTIFFGVDGADANFIDHGDATAGMRYIKDYFRIVTGRVTRAGFNVGVYGSGLACDKLVSDTAGSPRWCWLSMSTGHPNSQQRESAGRWAIKQCAERAKFLGTSKEVDPDILDNPNADFGQW